MQSAPTNVVVVDGSNIATEGRSMPSLAQLNEAVMAFEAEHPDATITVVVDATFGHRISKSEVADFDAAVAHNELVAPPAGAIGRGDAFVLSIANKVGARILSNDSFQEFHGQYDWLFDEGRLIGGKPVPFVGWIFVPRLPVKGPASRKATRATRNGGETTSNRRTASRASSQPMPVPTSPPPSRRAAGAQKSGTSTPAAAPARNVATVEPAAVSGPAVNDLLPFIEFVEQHPVGSSVNGVVESYSSHGAYVTVGDLKGYVPLRLMGDPPPRSAREIMRVGDAVTLVVANFAPARCSVDLAVPAVAGTVAPADAGSAGGPDAVDAAAAKAAPRKRAAKKTAAASTGTTTTTTTRRREAVAVADPARTSADAGEATSPTRRRRQAAAAGVDVSGETKPATTTADTDPAAAPPAAIRGRRRSAGASGAAAAEAAPASDQPVAETAQTPGVDGGSRRRRSTGRATATDRPDGIDRPDAASAAPAAAEKRRRRSTSAGEAAGADLRSSDTAASTASRSRRRSARATAAAEAAPLGRTGDTAADSMSAEPTTSSSGRRPRAAASKSSAAKSSAARSRPAKSEATGDRATPARGATPPNSAPKKSAAKKSASKKQAAKTAPATRRRRSPEA